MCYVVMSFFTPHVQTLESQLLSFFFSSRRRHTRCLSDWSSDVCSSDLQRAQPEHRRDLPLGAPPGLRVDVGAPRLVRGAARIGERVVGQPRRVPAGRGFADLDRVPVRAVRAVRSVAVAVRVVPAHVALAPIHTAAPTRAPIPTIHPTMPSETGPIRPRPWPPGLPSWVM